MRSSVIAKAQAADASALAALCAEHACYERLAACPAGHASHLYALLDQREPALHAWIAWHGGDAIGYASATIDVSTLSATRFLHMDCLYVTERWRGYGIGQQLFDAVKVFAREHGLPEMQWQTPDWNHDAIRFYQRNGASMLAKQRFTLQLKHTILARNSNNNMEQQQCKII